MSADPPKYMTLCEQDEEYPDSSEDLDQLVVSELRKVMTSRLEAQRLADPRSTAEASFIQSYTPIALAGLGSQGFCWYCLPKSTNSNRPLRDQLLIAKFDLFSSDRELAADAALPQHSALARVVDCEPDRRRWMVLPLIQGGTLRELRDTVKSRVPQAFLLHVLIELIEAVQALHKAGMVHCDLFAGNIMLDSSDSSFKDYPRVKIIDFGKANWEDISCNLIDPYTRKPYLGTLDIFFDREHGQDVESIGEVLHFLNYMDCNDELLMCPQRCFCGPETILEGDAAECFDTVIELTWRGWDSKSFIGAEFNLDDLVDGWVPLVKGLRDELYKPLPEDWDDLPKSRMPTESDILSVLAADSSADWRFYKPFPR